MTLTSEQIPSQRETENDTVVRLSDEAVIASPGTTYLLSANYKKGEDQPQILAEILTNPLGDGEQERLFVVDMRHAPLDSSNSKVFDGRKIADNIEYLLVDPSRLDWEKNKGYKGLRKGESFVYGRLGSSAERFQDLDPGTSRRHYSLHVDATGGLTAKDEYSLNGTQFLVGISVLESLSGGGKSHEVVRQTGFGAQVLEAVRSHIEAEAKLDQGVVLGAEMIERVVEEAVGKEQHYSTREMMSQPDLQPVIGVGVAGKEFYFSPIHRDSHDRLYAVGYSRSTSDDDRKIKPIMYYKSKSDGGWRVTPGLDYDGHFSKGRRTANGGYVQLTKPVHAIVRTLDFLETQPEATEYFGASRRQQLFDLELMEAEGINTFDSEVKVTMVRDETSPYFSEVADSLYESMEPGHGYYDARKSRQLIENMKLPRGFEPDFNADPIQTYRASHSIAGPVVVKVYEGEYKGKKVNWYVTEDSEDGVWLDKVTFADNDITSYGTAGHVMLLGALSAKPFEYSTQVNNMQPGIDFHYMEGDQNSRYVDLRKGYWAMMPWVQRYKLAQKQ